MWCSTILVNSSIAVTLSLAGRRRPPGGWKWTPLGASIWVWPGFARQALGVAPYALVKARVNASCDP